MSKPALIAAFLLVLILRWISQGTSQYAGVDDVKTVNSQMTLQKMVSKTMNNGKYNLGGIRYVRQVDRDYPGKDLGSGSPMSRAACGEWCNDNEDCAGFVRDLESQRCWIKKSMTGPPVRTKGKVSFIKM